VEVSKLQSLAKQAHEQSTALPVIDLKRLSLATDIARTFTLANTIDTSKMVNFAAIRQASKVFRPIVAPQISEAMKAMTPPPPSFTEALKGINAKTLESLTADLAGITEVTRNLGLPQTFRTDLAAALAARPPISPSEVRPAFAAVAERAADLAATEEFVQAVDKPASTLHLSPSDRLELASAVLAVIATLLLLEVYLLKRSYVESAGTALLFIAALLHLHSFVTSKLD
jgi:hypothetical protein